MATFLKVLFLLLLLSLSSMGEEPGFWLIRETNLWFSVATSPTIVVGRIGFHGTTNDRDRDCAPDPNGIQPTILVEKVLKGPENLDVLSVIPNAIWSEESLSQTNGPHVYFFSTCVDSSEVRHLADIPFAPIFTLPAKPENIRKVEEEVLCQKNETENFSDVLSSTELPFSEEIRKRFDTVVSCRGETEEVDWLCQIDFQKVPALICLITNDIPLNSTTLAFANHAENAIEPVARYLANSTVGLISIVTDRCLGMGIFSAYDDTTLAKRKHLQDMWRVFLLRWVEQSQKAGKLLRPALVFECGVVH